MRKFASAVGVSFAAAGLVLGASGIANAADTTFGSGLWFVGDDIASGVYEAHPSGYTSCNWTRYSDKWAEIDDQRTMASTVRVTIQYSDHAFSSFGCGTWKRVADAPAPDMTGAAIGSAVVGSAVVGSAVLPLLVAGSAGL